MLCQIQECVDKFERVFVVSARNLQNAIAEELREGWAHSRWATSDWIL